MPTDEERECLARAAAINQRLSDDEAKAKLQLLENKKRSDYTEYIQLLDQHTKQCITDAQQGVCPCKYTSNEFCIETCLQKFSREMNIEKGRIIFQKFEDKGRECDPFYWSICAYCSKKINEY